MSVLQLQELLLELALDSPQLGLGLPALLGPLPLDVHDLIQGGDELLIGVLEGLDVHHAPLGLPGGLDGAHLEHVRILSIVKNRLERKDKGKEGDRARDGTCNDSEQIGYLKHWRPHFPFLTLHRTVPAKHW